MYKIKLPEIKIEKKRASRLCLFSRFSRFSSNLIDFIPVIDLFIIFLRQWCSLRSLKACIYPFSSIFINIFLSSSFKKEPKQAASRQITTFWKKVAKTARFARQYFLSNGREQLGLRPKPQLLGASPQTPKPALASSRRLLFRFCLQNPF